MLLFSLFMMQAKVERAKQRLSKVLAAAGVASRRASEELIFQGKVKVNGEVVLVPQTMVNPETDEILVQNNPIKPIEDKVYYLLNKPVGYVCSTKGNSRSMARILKAIAHNG